LPEPRPDGNHRFVANRLAGESSPYLRQHAHNPVDWYPWGDEAFEKAKKEGKPVLLSVGYSACHWCHVMERESFDDPEIAALMNRSFVNVKVDREERPDVDDLYMKAVQLVTGRGGWPMTVFLTPEREPFHGGTYFPPVDRHGMPGFPRVLQAISQAFHDRPADVAKAVSQLKAGIAKIDEVVPGTGEMDPTLPLRVAESFLDHVDRVYGGLGQAPKFPNTSAFQLMLRQAHAHGRRDLLDAVTLTCRRMAEGGMYDQIGGGFHRYSVDQQWLAPHFEKMLYDNVQLPRLYLELFQKTGDELCRRVVTETLDYLLREMRDAAGGFYSATDADSEGHEGRYFVWTPAEVAAVVPERDRELVSRYWDITEEGNFEGRNIAHVSLPMDDLARSFGRDPADVAAALARSRGALYEARSRRVAPLRDEKVLTSWNGLAIGVFAEAGRVLGVDGYVEAAVATADFLWNELRRDGRLLHTWFAGRAKQEAFLDDHALFAAGLLDLYAATGEARHLERARELMASLEARFHDPEAGGYFYTPSDGERLIARTKPGADGSLPSGNGVATVVLLRLAALTGIGHYGRRAEEILRLFQEPLTRNPFSYVTFVEALERHLGAGTEVVLIGPAGLDMRSLERTVAEAYVPHLSLVRATTDGEDVPPLARGREAVDGRPTAYVCRHFTCSRPLTQASDLRALLAEGV
jgi:uncharacterized protein YyaL (SSP411 family)